MTVINVKHETFFYALALLVGLALRLANAGTLPLTNAEAVLALQALAISHGSAPLLAPQPGYLALTAIAMTLFQASTFVARFWPAFAGALLVLSPVLFRKYIGAWPAALLAVFLAVDPGLIAVARHANGLPLALLGLVLAFGWGCQRRYGLAGVALGVALLGGPQVWPGLLVLLASGWLMRPSMPRAAETQSNISRLPANWLQGGLAVAVTLFIGGTAFFFLPDGLSAWAGSLAVYMRGWVVRDPSAMSLAGMAGALAGYEFLALIFGVWGGLRSLWKKDPVDRFFLVWGLLALLFAMVYPARQVMDLAWSLLPFGALAVRQIVRLVDLPTVDRLTAVGQALLSATILAYVSLSLMMAANQISTSEGGLDWRLRVGGALLLWAASIGLIAWGWSGRVALRGAVGGLGVLLLFYTLSAAWNASGLADRRANEVWQDGTALQETSFLDREVRNLNQWALAPTGGQDVAVVHMDAPALRWALRDVPRLTFTDQLPVEAAPGMVITPDEKALGLSVAYRGTRFVLSETVDWKALSLTQWFRWMALRVAPEQAVHPTYGVFWARTDLFPDDHAVQSNGTGR